MPEPASEGSSQQQLTLWDTQQLSYLPRLACPGLTLPKLALTPHSPEPFGT